MTVIPKKQRALMAQEPYYHRCARRDALDDHICFANPVTGHMIEWEHALKEAGKKCQKRFSIVPLCWYTHTGPGQNKRIAEWLALNRASFEELEELTALGGRDYFRYRDWLNEQYGVYKSGDKPVEIMGIDYGYSVERTGTEFKR